MMKLALSTFAFWMGLTGIAKADAVTDAFVGSYTLKHAVYGLCEPQLNVFTMGSSGGFYSITMGPYFFNRVNGGAWTEEDTVVREVNQTYTVGNDTIVSVQKTYTKPTGTNSVYVMKATLKTHDLLDISTRDRETTSDLRVECIYHRNPAQ